ncbi:MAG: sulfatase [Betaproteobacteria bacterium]|nr:sulfatase [Betaproteobacteria bacterium]
MAKKPNLIVILIDDLRFDETSATGHPYMQTPHIDRIAREGAMFTNAFHTTPLCSPNRASILTGQYASRHGIIDNVGRDIASHRLDNFNLELKKLGYETAHVGKWHMGNDSSPRPGYDHWVSFKGQGQLENPILWENGGEHQVQGYMTDILNQRAVDFVKKKRKAPFSMFFAHKAVHPDLIQNSSGGIDADSIGGYTLPERHKTLYEGKTYPKRPNMLPLEEVARDKPALKMLFEARKEPVSRDILAAMDGGTQEEIRKRAAMMASVDEGVGMLLKALEETRQLDNTCIIFLGDNGFFFGEHGLTVERRFAYEEGIRTAFFVRYPKRIAAGAKFEQMILAIDIAPTLIELAGGKPGDTVQGRSLLPIMKGKAKKWRQSFLCEYWSEGAWPWIVGMGYKAVRTERWKYIHWTHHQGMAELYDLQNDPYEMKNLAQDPAYAKDKEAVKKELRKLTAEALGI